MLNSYIIRFIELAVAFALDQLLRTTASSMAFKKILLVVAASAVLNFASALPDSAGIVEMVNGLAYGGIPYGSVSGMVANYGKSGARQIPNYPAQNIQQNHELVLTQTSRRVVAPLSRGPGAAVQIFSHPGVVAPGVVGMIHNVGYQ